MKFKDETLTSILIGTIIVILIWIVVQVVKA